MLKLTGKSDLPNVTYWQISDTKWAVGIWGPRAYVSTEQEAKELAGLLLDGYKMRLAEGEPCSLPSL